MAQALIAAAAILWSPSAAARGEDGSNYPCPGGPGPGEVQIGTEGGSHGIAAYPICTRNGGFESGGGGGSSRSEPMHPPIYDPLAEMMAEQIWAEMQVEDRQKQLQADPRYRRYKQGEWQYFPGRRDSAPGDNCTAMWTREGGIVSITGPGPHYDGGMLTFWGSDIPRPSKVQTITVTFKQSTHPAQTVKAINFALPDVDFGAIALSVHTIDAALATMRDVESFELQMGGTTVAKASWTGGLAAKKKLQSCVAKRASR